MNDFDKLLSRAAGEALRAVAIETLQVNMGPGCNQRCAHCHLEASPDRQERIEWDTLERVLSAAKTLAGPLLDLTGGEPERHPDFRRFVQALRREGLPVQVRTNLTALLEPGMSDLPEFFRMHQVRLVGSLPCYEPENVEAQRGKGVYQKSIAAIRRLNTIGYGVDRDLPLRLVHNPNGAFLPPEQAALEADYRRELGTRFGIAFSSLITITNMPIGRFLSFLRAEGKEDEYRDLLRRSFNPKTVEQVMCRRQISVGWDGRLYDCDFNLALGLPVEDGVPRHIARFDASRLARRRIVTGDHCFGCTAGHGSSCKGALV